jgi:hypothetical protein
MANTIETNNINTLPANQVDHATHAVSTNVIRESIKRYNMITSVISKKIEILKGIKIYRSKFYFEVPLNIDGTIGLSYDYDFDYTDTPPKIFQISYYDIRGFKDGEMYILITNTYKIGN